MWVGGLESKSCGLPKKKFSLKHPISAAGLPSRLQTASAVSLFVPLSQHMSGPKVSAGETNRIDYLTFAALHTANFILTTDSTVYIW